MPTALKKFGWWCDSVRGLRAHVQIYKAMRDSGGELHRGLFGKAGFTLTACSSSSNACSTESIVWTLGIRPCLRSAVAAIAVYLHQDATIDELINKVAENLVPGARVAWRLSVLLEQNFETIRARARAAGVLVVPSAPKRTAEENERRRQLNAIIAAERLLELDLGALEALLASPREADRRVGEQPDRNERTAEKQDPPDLVRLGLVGEQVEREPNHHD